MENQKTTSFKQKNYKLNKPLSNLKIKLDKDIITKFIKESNLIIFKSLFFQIANSNQPDLDLLNEVKKSFRYVMQIFNNFSKSTLISTEDKKKVSLFVRNDFFPLVCLSKWSLRSFIKPNGAGDHFTVSQIYNKCNHEKREIGKIINQLFLNEPSCKAVQNRKKVLTDYMLKLLEKKNLSVISLACGPSIEIFNLFDKLEDKSKISIIGLDIDKRALSSVDDQIKEKKLSKYFETLCRNVLYFPKNNEIKPETQDLIYSLGLIDYFSDRLVVRLLNSVYPLLKKEGTIILGNFHPSNPSKAMMDYILDWKLIHRTEEDLQNIFKKSLFSQSNIEFIYEPEKVQLFAVCKKNN